MNNPYHPANEAERAKAEICDEYDLLIGPNGFECFLGEPEDRSWYRDASDVVSELNRLAAENASLLSALKGCEDSMQERGDSLSSTPAARKRWNAALTAARKARGE
jgi:hypothetical protein